MSGALGVSGESFCNTYFPLVTEGETVLSSQESQLRGFLTTVAAGGIPNIPDCAARRRLLAVENKCDEVTGLFQRPLTAPFFDGSHTDWRSPANNSVTAGNDLPDFTQGDSATEALLDRLTAFFGQPSALNCSQDAEFPTYEGRVNQNDVHKNMPINETVFNEFVSAIVDTGVSYGISASDLAPVGALLNSFKRHTASPDTDPATICNQDDCDCAPEAEGGINCKEADSSSSSSSSTGGNGTDSSSSSSSSSTGGGGGDGGAASTLSVSFLALAATALVALIRQ